MRCWTAGGPRAPTRDTVGSAHTSRPLCAVQAEMSRIVNVGLILVSVLKAALSHCIFFHLHQCENLSLCLLVASLSLSLSLSLSFWTDGVFSIGFVSKAAPSLTAQTSSPVTFQCILSPSLSLSLSRRLTALSLSLSVLDSTVSRWVLDSTLSLSLSVLDSTLSRSPSLALSPSPSFGA